jgi:hypothetical protein
MAAESEKTRTERDSMACAPREELELLVGGIQAMVTELDWFESKASGRAIDLDALSPPAWRGSGELLWRQR